MICLVLVKSPWRGYYLSFGSFSPRVYDYISIKIVRVTTQKRPQDKTPQTGTATQRNQV